MVPDPCAWCEDVFETGTVRTLESELDREDDAEGNNLGNARFFPASKASGEGELKADRGMGRGKGGGAGVSCCSARYLSRRAPVLMRFISLHSLFFPPPSLGTGGGLSTELGRRACLPFPGSVFNGGGCLPTASDTSPSIDKLLVLVRTPTSLFLPPAFCKLGRGLSFSFSSSPGFCCAFFHRPETFLVSVLNPSPAEEVDFTVPLLLIPSEPKYPSEVHPNPAA